MLEERGRVVGVDGDHLLVETQRRSTCDACGVQRGCGTGALSKVLGRRANRLRVLAGDGAAVGDEVVIGLAEEALLRGSLALYLVPLALMLLFAVLGDHLNGRLVLGSEALVAGFAVAGLLLGFGWVRWFAHSVRSDQRYQPVILRRLP